MKTKILKTEKEYNEACKRIYMLMHSTDKPIELDTPEADEIELLSLLIEKYERKHYPIQAPDPIEAIKFRMEQMNLKQIDIAPLFGGKTRISEVLNRKRPLTLRVIALLNRYLGIPLESLIIGNKDIKLNPPAKKKILKIPSVKEYLQAYSEKIIDYI